MPCTTILVGKKASYDGSTMIARNDDGGFDVKHKVVVTKNMQPKLYKSVIGHLEIELPDNPLTYTTTPNVKVDEAGLWPAMGINELNVAMTATETISINAIALGADPFVTYQKAQNEGEKDIPGGIGEEDIVTLVLPYIKSAREGVLRLGNLLEKYGTYESNGIAFSDENEIWYLETIGGHHFMAARVEDDRVVIMPNQLGIDYFDFDDAYGDKKNFICSSDLLEFVQKNHLNFNTNDIFNPRNAFGTHRDQDHVYNTPRAWYMARFFNPTKYKFEGENADFNPESDDIPWSLKPERLVTIEDIKYLLGSYYQGTPYNPYNNKESLRGKYRPIGVINTDTMSILQIRGYMKDKLKSIEWLSFGCNAFNCTMPLYTNVSDFPDYISKTSKTLNTNDFFWASRLLGALVDPHFGKSIQVIERYQNNVFSKSYELLNRFDKEYLEKGEADILNKANFEIADMVKEKTQNVLNTALQISLNNSKLRYSREDN